MGDRNIERWEEFFKSNPNMNNKLYHGTKNALKQCGLYKEKNNLDIFDIVKNIKINNDTILVTKADLEKYCKENNLCMEQIENDMINKFYEWFNIEIKEEGDANVNE